VSIGNRGRSVSAIVLLTSVSLTGWPGSTSSAAGLTCATPANGAELAIRTGWPEAKPLEHVVIATIREIQPENGDAGTWGEVLTVDVDAVLRGDLPLSTLEIFNAPLGASGWVGFRPGAQYLIAAGPASEGTGGRPATSLCAPNEEITSPDRFAELVSFATEPRLSNTALPSRSALTGWGIALLLVAFTLGVVTRRSMKTDGLIH
jgi:hypothetical protein